MSSGWMTHVAPMPLRPPFTNGFSVCHVLLSAILKEPLRAPARKLRTTKTHGDVVAAHLGWQAGKRLGAACR
jgi:hypothetical protein